MKILLMGNPNVGKSVVFSRLTGVNVVASNYPGTTVEFTSGTARVDGEKVDIFDVPGTYSLEPTSKAEEVARDMFTQGDPDVVINIIDATALERNLFLTLHILEHGVPVIVVLNMWDVAQRKGITIDTKKLSEMLQVPVIPTVAVTGEGIKEVVDTLSERGDRGARSPLSDDEKWQFIGEVTQTVQTIEHKHPSFLEKLEDASVKALTGIPIAFAVMCISFLIIRIVGEGLISLIGPFFESYYGPFITHIVESAVPSGLVHDLLIGTTPDFVESFGLLTTGLYVPFGMVLPYVFSFYVVLGVLEDVGYLPRLAVLVDNVMHRLGLHGSSIIPMVLGLGCNVPGVLATRILETNRERFIAAALMAVAVPCMAQNAVIIGLVGQYGLIYLGVVYGTLFTVYLAVGYLLNKILRGESPELFLEIPDYHVPNIQVLLKKTWMRMRGFLMEAVPFVLIGVFVVNILYIVGVIDFLAAAFAPLLERLLGLPRDAIVALLIGFLRKDVAVGMLEPLHLLPQQLVVACTVLALYFPCIATFAVLLKELGVKDTLQAVGIMMVAALAVGGVLRILLEWII